jgi:hypothetical protein
VRNANLSWRMRRVPRGKFDEIHYGKVVRR